MLPIFDVIVDIIDYIEIVDKIGAPEYSSIILQTLSKMVACGYYR